MVVTSPGRDSRAANSVADDHDACRGKILFGHGLQQRVHFGGPVAHGHHGDTDPRFPHALTPSRHDDRVRDASRSL
jgi:hypothetical protein